MPPRSPRPWAARGILLHEKDPEFIAGTIKTLLDDPDLRERLLARQDQRYERVAAFDVDTVILEALEEAMGAETPLRIQVQGPFETSYSLALLNRRLALALNIGGDLDVSLYATEGPGDYVPKPELVAADPTVAAMHERSEHVPYPDVVIRQLYPPRVHDAPGGLNLLYFGWEESRLPKAYVEEFNRHLDGIGTMSAYVRDVLRNSGVRVPIEVMGVGVERPDTSQPPALLELPPHRGFTFLHISSAFPRKGVDVLLAAYFDSFCGKDDVTLVLKTFPNPHNDVDRLLEETRDRHADPPRVVWIDRDLPDIEVQRLYGIADCYVHPSRGEGFGLPVAEAMLASVLTVVVPHSGLADFCSDDTSVTVPYRVERANTHLSVPGSTWAEPDKVALASALRHVFEHQADPDLDRRRDRGAHADRGAVLVVSSSHSMEHICRGTQRDEAASTRRAGHHVELEVRHRGVLPAAG